MLAELLFILETALCRTLIVRCRVQRRRERKHQRKSINSSSPQRRHKPACRFVVWMIFRCVPPPKIVDYFISALNQKVSHFPTYEGKTTTETQCLGQGLSVEATVT